MFDSPQIIHTRSRLRQLTPYILLYNTGMRKPRDLHIPVDSSSIISLL